MPRDTNLPENDHAITTTRRERCLGQLQQAVDGIAVTPHLAETHACRVVTASSGQQQIGLGEVLVREERRHWPLCGAAPDAEGTIGRARRNS